MKLATYKNGNYTVTIYSDGTKVREGDGPFIPAFPESIDIKITNYCDLGCLYCHEGSTKLGEHGDMSEQFIDTLHPFTELAIGGGNPLSHPNLLMLLERCKQRNVICNMTVNQTHFEEYIVELQYLVNTKRIYGIGVSVTEPTDNLIKLLHQFPNIVVHTIAGVTTEAQFKKLSNNGLKVLILGYKLLRRGETYHLRHKVEANITRLRCMWPKLCNKFDVLSFDNLALHQLRVKEVLPKELWDSFYMGDDGQFTMYVDLVEREFAASSVSPDRYDLLPDIRDMFAAVRELS